MLEAGKKVKYIGKDNWAYTHGKIYTVEGYDREFDAWAIQSDEDDVYLVGEKDLEEV